MSRGFAELADAIVERSAGGGGFAAVPGGPADTESTALVALAWRDAADGVARGAVDWLASRQRADGAWPLTDEVAGPSWASAWAAIALTRHEAGAEPLGRLADWLVARQGRRPGLLARALGRLAHVEDRVEQDLALRGWPWHESAASWVEPTATAMLALRVLGSRVVVAGGRERVEEGERLLWDRACVDGGWNYGNRRVLGEALAPYPDTTAFALLALQESRRSDALAQAFTALEALLDERASSLSLALAALATEAHARDATTLRARLEASLAHRGLPRETRSLSFAWLALSGGAALLRVPA